MKDDSEGMNCLIRAIIQEIYHRLLGGILKMKEYQYRLLGKDNQQRGDYIYRLLGRKPQK